MSDAGPTSAPASKIYVKILVNLRPNNATSTQQNVLLVERYPTTLSGVGSFTTLPNAACGVLPQASTSTTQAVCSGTKYTTAIAFRGSHQVSTKTKTAGEALSDASSLRAYPNPAASSVRFRFTTTQPGHVRVFLSDALGREVVQVLETDKVTAGTFETDASVASLQPGIYYCTLLTPSGQIVQKLVVSQ